MNRALVFTVFGREGIIFVEVFTYYFQMCAGN